MEDKFTKDILRAALVIQSGGVIVCPSEGVYGISCSLFNEDAIKRVISIKERDVSKGLIIVDHTLDKLSAYIDNSRLNEKAKELINKMWPGPHTFVLPIIESFNSIAEKENHTAAVRITAFEALKEICKQAGTPIISTSANISGKAATSVISQLDSVIVDRVDLVLDLPCGGQSSPTSIYDTTTNTLVRKGPGWNL
jgi:L-threonylcarbamoyladenylate synthase